MSHWTSRLSAPRLLGAAALADIIDRRAILGIGNTSPLSDPDQFRVGYHFGGLQLPSPTLAVEVVIGLGALWLIGALLLLLAPDQRGQRFGAVAVMVASGTVLSLDQQTYANHTWLIWLLCGLFVGSRSDFAWLSRSLATIVYVAAAVSKLRAPWLSGETLVAYLDGPLGLRIAQRQSPELIRLVAWGAIATELALAALIWAPVARRWRLVIVASFHLLIIAVVGLDAGLVSFGLAMLVHLTADGEEKRSGDLSESGVLVRRSSEQLIQQTGETK